MKHRRMAGAGESGESGESVYVVACRSRMAAKVNAASASRFIPDKVSAACISP